MQFCPFSGRTVSGRLSTPQTTGRAEYSFPQDRFCDWRRVSSQSCLRGVSKPRLTPQPWCMSSWRLRQRFLASTRNFPGLVWPLDGAQIANIYWVSRPCCRENIRQPSSSRPLPHVSLCESCLFCGNKHILAPFWLSVASGKAKLNPVLVHESSLRSASPILAEATCLGEWGAEQKGSMLILRPQAVCRVVRSTMFWLKSWSHLSWVSARQDKYWTLWWNLIEPELRGRATSSAVAIKPLFPQSSFRQRRYEISLESSTA